MVRFALLGFAALAMSCGRYGFHDFTDGGADDVAAQRDAPFSPHGETYIKASNTGYQNFFGKGIALSRDGNTLAVGALGESSASIATPNDTSAHQAGAVYIYVRAGATWAFQAYLKAAHPDASDDFGYMLALSSDGNTLAVGAPGESSAATGINGNDADNSDAMAGAAYVFTRTGAAWSQQAYVKASNTDAGDQFGAAVALSGTGDTLAIGAFTESSNAQTINGNQADNSAYAAGAVYVYARTGGAWTQQAYVKSSNGKLGATFGVSDALSASGDELVVGELGDTSGIDGDPSDTSLQDVGAVFVFSRAGTTWTQTGYLKEPHPHMFDSLGRAVAVSDDGAVIVATADNESSSARGVNGDDTDTSLQYAGAAFTYRYTGGAWTHGAYLKASNPDVQDHFGYTLAMSSDGSTVAVGTYVEASAASGLDGDQADNSAIEAGAAYIFTCSAATCAQQAYVKAATTWPDMSFAIAIAISADGSTFAAGAWDESRGSMLVGGDQQDQSVLDSGAAYIIE